MASAESCRQSPPTPRSHRRSLVLAWLTTRVELAPELLRAPSLIAGSTATIPLIYLVGYAYRWAKGRPVGGGSVHPVAIHDLLLLGGAWVRGGSCIFVLASTLLLLVAFDRRALRASGSAMPFLPTRRGLQPLHGRIRTRRPACLAAMGRILGRAFRGCNTANAGCGPRVPPLARRACWVTLTLRRRTSSTRSTCSRSGSVLTSLEHWSVGYPYVFPSTSLGEDARGSRARAVRAWSRLRLFAGLVGSRSVDACEPASVARRQSEGSDRCARARGAGRRGALQRRLDRPPRRQDLAVSWPAFALLVAAVLAAGPRCGRRPTRWSSRPSRSPRSRCGTRGTRGQGTRRQRGSSTGRVPKDVVFDATAQPGAADRD